MFEKIFNEIFGDLDFEENINDFAKIAKEYENKEDGENHSYFHRIVNKYDENGRQISHKEKEVKDGKVLKDVDNTINIEDKRVNEDITFYKKNLKQATDLLEEAQQTILNQQQLIEEKENRCKELENKLSKVMDLLK